MNNIRYEGISMNAKKITYSAVCLALAMVLPFISGQIPQIGNMLGLIHIPIFLCGFLCGWKWGLAVGFIAPILRSLIFASPAMIPGGVSMAFELAAYGFFSGLLYRVFPKRIPFIYLTLIISMLCGRIVWGIVRLTVAGLTQTDFPMSLFIAGAITNCLPGIALHIILVPLTVMALDASGMIKE